MRNRILALFSLVISLGTVQAQKKPIDHSVYDSWQSTGDRKISSDGQWIVYTVVPQEGDGQLIVQKTDGSYRKVIDRGTAPKLTANNKALVFTIKPFHKDTREARIKKKKPEEMPKDTLAVLQLGTDSVMRITQYKSFKIPEKNEAWLAVLMDKAPADTAARTKKTAVANPLADSLRKVIDSLQQILSENEARGKKKKRIVKSMSDGLFADFGFLPPDTTPANKRMNEGTELVLYDLINGKRKSFPFVSEYVFDKNGTTLVLEVTPNKKDSTSELEVHVYDFANDRVQVIFRNANDVKSYTFNEEGTQLAFIAERDSSTKALQKFYSLYTFNKGDDSAQLRINRFTSGMPDGFTVSEQPNIRFSKSGTRIFFGTAPIKAPRDTTIVESETARLDIWHYADDYLQPQQLRQLATEQNRSYLATIPANGNGFLQLGSPDLENVVLINEGDAPYVLASTNKPGRVQSQWTGKQISHFYLIHLNDGRLQKIRENHSGYFTPSAGGRFLLWYNQKDRHFYSYEMATGKIRNVSAGIKYPVWDEEDDHPDDPPTFGVTGWLENDEAVLIYDRYDIWSVDPLAQKAPVCITNGMGRKNNTELRRIRVDREERHIRTDAPVLLEAFNRKNKYAGFYKLESAKGGKMEELFMGPYSFTRPDKAADAEAYIVTRMNIQESPDVYYSSDLKNFTRISALNPQQSEYNWLTVELVKWKMFDGLMAEGLLYKPENFDSTKKYPVIFYFYEKNADDLHKYKAPAPSASTINIPYFVSNGYIVFDPNIYYKTGQPGEDAYNSVVSAAKFMTSKPWVNAKKMGIQGQSWGGYQVAYLVTRTNMFAAAGAGAPVANMTSAYGGIRWGTGMNRQFQYEKTQSRIGATLWERPDLYIKNSPLFAANKVNTPLLIMHNDADGAVPWYQGIEYFTALRRLGKKVWMLQYNNEDHNLVERRNRKDLSIRLAQFFDHYLKDAPAAKWIREGVPATEKG